MAGVLCLAALLPATALAQTSTFCPTPLTATVAWGGSVSVDVSDCDGFADGGMSGPIAPLAQHGTVNIGLNSGNVQFVTYTHDTALGGTSDVIWLEDENTDTVRIDITITPQASAIVVAPSVLPTIKTGVAFSQTLTSSGGTAPYNYSVTSGALPSGLSLSSGGVLSGTPTQRGGYTFNVRSQDNVGDFVDKGYAGTVQDPTLAISPTSATAVQGAAFSQQLTVTGGVPPQGFQLETGSLPAGIAISSTGLISGTTAAAPGNYPVTLRVTDGSTGPGSYFEVENFTLTVSPPPSVSIAVAPASVSEDGATNLTYTVTRSLNLSSPTVVNITTSGSATSGTDYTGGVATATIAAGATTATITLNPTIDATVETDETATLTVAAGSGYTVGAPASATGTILNDDVPSASISVSPATVSEDGATNLVYTVTLSQPSLTATSVGFTVTGSATFGVDYGAAPSPLVIPAGSTTGTWLVDPAADASIEADETVIATVVAGAGYTVGAPASATGTIVNDDLPTLTINDVSLLEGNAGTANAPFTVFLNTPAGPGGVTFDIATANATATGGVDYGTTSLTSQTIPAGAMSYTFIVPINGDALNEATETYFVNVTNVTGATVADGQGLGTITNDDALPSLSINDVSVVEGNAGTTNAVFTVSLSAASGQTVTVNYSTVFGATSPGDFNTIAGGTLTFAPGVTTQTVTAGIGGDTIPEADETYVIQLSGEANATISDSQGAGVIVNDDVPVTVSPTTLPNGTVAAAYSQGITASGGTAPYTFAITAGALPAGLTLAPTGTLGGTPTAGGTFSFTVTATDSSGSPGPFSGNQAYTLTIAAASVTLPATTLSTATLGSAYSQALNPATGGTAPYSYAVTAGALPPGLTLSGTGTVSGTPTAVGTFNFSVTATDSSTGTGPYSSTPRSYSLTVIDVAPIANPVSATVAYGSGANPITLNITGGAATSVAIGTAPANGTAIASGTSITYQPNAGYAGPASFTYTATNSGGTSAPATVSITVSDPAITISASGGFAATVAAPYSQTFTWNGGTQPWSGHQVTNLPAGLSISGTTANSVTISGTPTQAGTFAMNVSATDSSTGNGPYAVGQVFNLTVAAPTLAMTPAGTTFTAPYGAAFSQSFSASGGVGPYSYALTSGALPAGVTLSGGALSGTPTVSGSFTFTVTATDDGSSGAGAPFTVAQNYVLNVPAPTITVDPATLPNPAAGVGYSQSLTASGAVAPYTFAVSAGALPAGITLAPNGALGGTSNEVGSFNFTVTATDANGQAGSRAYTVVIAAPTLTMTPSAGTLTLPYGAAYSQAFVAGGSAGPYNYVLTGTLPAGVSFSGNVLSGTPTVPGSYAITVTATDTVLTGAGAPFSVAQNYVLNVPAPTITVDPATLPDTTAGLAYSQAISASGAVAPYTFAVTAGALPNGVSLASNGALSGTTTTSGTFSFTVTATDAHGQTGSRAYTVVVAVPTLSMTPGNLPAGTAGTAYSQALTISGGIAPYTVVQTGALPAGISFNTATRTFSGTPTQSGSFAITVTATDSTAGTAATISTNYTLTIAAPTLTLTPATLPGASAGTAYSQTFVASGGVGAYTYTLSAGALPAGLALNATSGALAGTPTAAGTFNFSVTATDSTTGTAGAVTHAYSLVVSAPSITVNPPVLPSGVVGVPYTQAINAVGGTAPYTFAVTAGALPAGLALSADGRITGEPTAGAYAFTVRATDALGFTGTRAYSLQVVDRPDPSRDPEVRGLLEAQSDSARRFASTQIGNFQQRMENLHDNRAAAQLSNRLSFATSQACVDYFGRKPGDPCGNAVAANGPVAMTGSASAQAADGNTSAQGGSGSGVSTWIGGVIRSGNQDGRNGGAGADFETDGVSAGADYRFSPAFVLGAGIGFGRDEGDIGRNGSHLEGDAYALAVYASAHPGDRFFFDVVFGYQKLSYDQRRFVTATDGFVEGSRDGRQWFGSVSTGAQFQHDNWQLTPYARIDVSRTTLDAFVEQGDPVFALAYREQDLDASTGNIGLRIESRHVAGWGAFAPQLRLEYQQDFSEESRATMQYADLLTGPLYSADLAGFDRNRFMLGVGAMFYLPRELALRVEYRGLFGNNGDRDNGFMLNLEKSY